MVYSFRQTPIRRNMETSHKQEQSLQTVIQHCAIGNPTIGISLSVNCKSKHPACLTGETAYLPVFQHRAASEPVVAYRSLLGIREHERLLASLFGPLDVAYKLKRASPSGLSLANRCECYVRAVRKLCEDRRRHRNLEQSVQGEYFRQRYLPDCFMLTIA